LPLAHYFLASSTGEPNEVCSQAYGIMPGPTHSFFAEDREDWYRFTLPAAGELTVRLGNFVPLVGQIAVFRGESCGTAVFLQNNGNSGAEKIVSLGLQPAGQYFVFVSNDGALNSSDPYTLQIELH
jgi:hypothetical protein